METEARFRSVRRSGSKYEVGSIICGRHNSLAAVIAKDLCKMVDVALCRNRKSPLRKPLVHKHSERSFCRLCKAWLRVRNTMNYQMEV